MQKSSSAEQRHGDIRAVLFDFGGVLAEEGFRRGLKEIARRHDADPERFFELAAEAVYQSGYVTGHGSEQDFWRLVAKESGLDLDFEESTELILRRFVLRPAMLDAVRRLKQAGLIVAILSDQTDWLDRLEKRDGFFHLFDRVFNSYHLGKGKRDPSLFDEAVEALQVAPGQTLFIDDNAGHIDRARSRGLQAIHFQGEDDCLQALEDKLAIAVAD